MHNQLTLNLIAKTFSFVEVSSKTKTFVTHLLYLKLFYHLFQTSSHEDIYTFEISHTLATDAGRYVVIATNSEGTEKCSVSLNVKELENTDTMDFRTLLKSRYSFFLTILMWYKITNPPPKKNTPSNCRTPSFVKDVTALTYMLTVYIFLM